MALQDGERDYERQFVTRRELKECVAKLPTRWEVRFLIVAAAVANQFVPVAEYAKAAIPWH